MPCRRMAKREEPPSVERIESEKFNAVPRFYPDRQSPNDTILEGPLNSETIRKAYILLCDQMESQPFHGDMIV